MNKDFWNSSYRRMFLPYCLEKINFIPEVWMDGFLENKHNYLILNRSYKVISDLGDVNFCGYSSGYQERIKANLAGSIISFARNPETFKGVWYGSPLDLYDDGVGCSNKLIENYFKRLSKLFKYTHTFVGSRTIDSLMEHTNLFQSKRMNQHEKQQQNKVEKKNDYNG